MPDQLVNRLNPNISEFATDSVVFEVRYSNAYLLWDIAGRTWGELLRQYPEMEMSDANPITQSFSWKKKHNFTISLAQSSVATVNPDNSIKEFAALAESLVGTLVTNLKIEVFTRVGLRQVFVYEHKSLKEATKRLLETGVVQPPKPPNFGIDVAEPLPEYVLRWENESVGATVRVKAAQQKVEIELPLQFKTQVPTVEKNTLIYDIDYYTRAPVTVGQFRARDWISNASQLMKRESAKFLTATND